MGRYLVGCALNRISGYIACLFQKSGPEDDDQGPDRRRQLPATRGHVDGGGRRGGGGRGGRGGGRGGRGYRNQRQGRPNGGGGGGGGGRHRYGDAGGASRGGGGADVNAPPDNSRVPPPTPAAATATGQGSGGNQEGTAPKPQRQNRGRHRGNRGRSNYRSEELPQAGGPSTENKTTPATASAEPAAT